MLRRSLTCVLCGLLDVMISDENHCAIRALEILCVAKGWPWACHNVVEPLWSSIMEPGPCLHVCVLLYALGKPVCYGCFPLLCSLPLTFGPECVQVLSVKPHLPSLEASQVVGSLSAFLHDCKNFWSCRDVSVCSNVQHNLLLS